MQPQTFQKIGPPEKSVPRRVFFLVLAGPTNAVLVTRTPGTFNGARSPGTPWTGVAPEAPPRSMARPVLSRRSRLQLGGQPVMRTRGMSLTMDCVMIIIMIFFFCCCCLRRRVTDGRTTWETWPGRGADMDAGEGSLLGDVVHFLLVFFFVCLLWVCVSYSVGAERYRGGKKP